MLHNLAHCATLPHTKPLAGENMNVKDKIQKQIAKKREELEELEAAVAVLQASITEINGVIKGFEEAIQLFPKEPTATNFEQDISNLRGDSDVGKAYKFIRNTGKPVRIEDIVEGIGKENTKKARQALAGQLSYNYREGRIFTRPKPNTFGLLVWAQAGNSQPKIEEEPDDKPGFDLPDTFGSEY